MKLLTKESMIEFFKRYIDPESPDRAKISVYMIAQAKRDISELVKGLDLEPEQASQVVSDLKSRLGATHHDEQKEIEGLKQYLLDLKVDTDKIDAAVESWRKLPQNRTNGVVRDEVKEPPTFNGIKPFIIEDARDYKSRLAASAGALPVKELSEYEDLNLHEDNDKT